MLILFAFSRKPGADTRLSIDEIDLTLIDEASVFHFGTLSLTDDPVEEVYAAKDILKAAGLRKEGVNIISCPTCGRTSIDLIGVVNQVDEALKNCEKPITVAVMGCVVNGPGEAREADIGIAGGDGWGMLFEKGEQVEKLPYDQLLPALLRRIENF